MGWILTNRALRSRVRGGPHTRYPGQAPESDRVASAPQTISGRDTSFGASTKRSTPAGSFPTNESRKAGAPPMARRTSQVRRRAPSSQTGRSGLTSSRAVTE